MLFIKLHVLIVISFILEKPAEPSPLVCLSIMAPLDGLITIILLYPTTVYSMDTRLILKMFQFWAEIESTEPFLSKKLVLSKHTMVPNL